MTFISYAQNYEDVMLWRALKNVHEGFYIDVGANDPETHSVTKVFYERGWRGLNIEPVTNWHEQLQKQRPRDFNLKVAAGAFEGEISFYEVCDTGLSTTNKLYAQQHADTYDFAVKEQIVPIRTLNAICNDISISEVHFLKIDVEGGELDVIRGLDLSILRPWIILVEATEPLTQVVAPLEWEPILIKAGYSFVYFDGLNRFYIDGNRPDLATAFEVPPNCWDDFIRHDGVERLLKENRKLAIDKKTLGDQIIQIESLYNSVINSQSWRITQPLRTINVWIQSTKEAKSIFAQKFESIKEEKKRLFKSIFKRVLSKIFSVTLLKYLINIALSKHPILRARILNLSPLSDSIHESGTLPNLLSKMSPQSKKIFSDLKKSISSR